MSDQEKSTVRSGHRDETTAPLKLSGSWTSRLTRAVAQTPAAFIVLMIVVALLPWLGVNAFYLQLFSLVLLYAMLTSGLNLTFGFCGELSFSQPAVFALGAYVGGYMALHGVNNLIVALIVGAVAAGIAGAIIGIPALRLGGWSMAMVSFFLLLVLPDIANVLQSQTGGDSGLFGIPPAEIFGTRLTPSGYFVVTVIVATLVILLMRNLVSSRHGRAFRVLRESPVLAQSLGINVYWLKVRAYAIGSAVGGVAGVLFAFLYGYVSPSDFGFGAAIALIAASVIGGMRSIYGCLFGAAIVEIGTYETSSFQQYSLIVYGALLVAVVVLLPLGFASLISRHLPAFLQPRHAGAAAAPAASITSAPQATDDGDYKRHVDKRSSKRRGVLRLEDIRKSFDGVEALTGVTLEAVPGKITGIIGPNGSGKTTLLNIIAGAYGPTSGVLSLDGVVISARRARRSLRNGIARTFQTPSMPEGLTTLEVVMTSRYRMDYVGMATTMLRLPKYWRVSRADEALAIDALSVVGIVNLADVEAASLPLGTRRLVEVARAVAAQPDVLLLDEPASGLSEPELMRLSAILERFRDDGGVVVLVEHNFAFISQLADMLYVLDLGRMLASGAPDEVRNNPDVVRIYLGEAYGPVVAPEQSI
jgi:branched-chain amino acid transport system permease protein